MLRNEPDPTPEEVLAHQNAMREARVRRELKTAAREADLRYDFFFMVLVTVFLMSLVRCIGY